jgi:hypothetical protein
LPAKDDELLGKAMLLLLLGLLELLTPELLLEPKTMLLLEAGQDIT